MKYAALLPLRGGSKSIPNKNIKEIAGEPLYAWALKAALNSGVFQDVYVSTDSEIIKANVHNHFPTVKLVDRKAELATDTASSDDVLVDFIKNHPTFDVICLVQATSPLTKPEDFILAKKKFESEKADSLVTGVRWKRFFWDDLGNPINYQPQSRPRRQEFHGWIMENGAFYLTKAAKLISDRHRLPGKVCIYEMAEEAALEVDEPPDWTTIEQLLFNKRSATKSREIKCVAFDIDGTLTDGGMYYNAEGEFSKKFNTKDAVGLRKLSENGYKIAAITAEVSAAVKSRLDKMGVQVRFEGVKNKVEVLDNWLNSMGMSWENLAFIGDDEMDVYALRKSGFAAAPSDAEECVKAIPGIYICKRSGGSGAVRDFCEKILIDGHH